MTERLKESLKDFENHLSWMWKETQFYAMVKASN